MSNVAIVGGGFAGLTAAVELRRLLPETETVTLISASDTFAFLPSLIWVVQGWREIDEITFPIRPVLDEAGIKFIRARLEQINPQDNTLTLTNTKSPFAQSKLAYDKLLIATGGEWAWDSLPGLAPKPDGHTISILSPQDALQARPHWQELLANPGPIVIGATINAGLYGAAYEFALNLDIALRNAGVRDQARIIFITPEPHLGHFGHGGLGNSRQILEDAFSSRNIASIPEAQITRIEEDMVIVGGQRRITSKFTMLVPPYRGIKPVRETPNLTDERGRIPVDDQQRSLTYPNIFAAGVAMQIKPPVTTTLPSDVLITGTASAEMGRIAANNITAALGFGQPISEPSESLKAFYMLDSGSRGFFMSLGPQSWLNLQLKIPGPWSHWAKSMVEKYQMWKLQAGKY